MYGKNRENRQDNQDSKLNISRNRRFSQVFIFLLERGIVFFWLFMYFQQGHIGAFLLLVQQSRNLYDFSYFFGRFGVVLKNYKSDLNFINIIEKLTKKPFKHVYICWTKSEQNLRYWLPKLATPLTKTTNNFSKVLTLKIHAKKSGVE